MPPLFVLHGKLVSGCFCSGACTGRKEIANVAPVTNARRPWTALSTGWRECVVIVEASCGCRSTVVFRISFDATENSRFNELVNTMLE